ncbi:hypothetical protein MMC15_001230 [Xylographa vitiligo]|nr:hypothetical protein [Xylographa vitiligo]
MSTPHPIQIHVPPAIGPLAIPLSRYLATHPSFSALATSACIFAPAHLSTPPTPRLLLLHRARTEPSFRNLWEIPGGGVEATDPTVLHALAREVGPGEVLTGGDERTPTRCQRLSFEIAVAEMTGDPLPDGRRASVGVEAAPMEETTRHGGATTARGLSALADVRVVVDAAEHQGFRWVSEAEVRAAPCLVGRGETGYFAKKRVGGEDGPGEGAVKLVFEDQRQVMLEAFAGHGAGGGGHGTASAGRGGAEAGCFEGA